MSHWPSRFETNATSRPSGESEGCASTPAKFVTRLKRIADGVSRLAVLQGKMIAAAAITMASAATAHAIIGGAASCRADGDDRRVGGLCRRILQFQPRVADIAQPPRRILLQAPSQQITNPAGRLRRQSVPVGLAADDSREDIRERPARERLAARQHLEQHAPERPDVGPPVDSLTSRLLGAHVGRGAQNGARFSRRGRDGRRDVGVTTRKRWRHRFGESEIDELDLPVRSEPDVGRLQVAMDDALRVGGVEAGGDLLRQGDGFADRNRTARNQIGERFALDERHHEKVDAVLCADVVQRTDVQMLDGRNRARFAFEALNKAGRSGDVRGKNLDGDRAIETRVARPIDFAHGPCSGQGLDLIRAEQRPLNECHVTVGWERRGYRKPKKTALSFSTFPVSQRCRKNDTWVPSAERLCW